MQMLTLGGESVDGLQFTVDSGGGRGLTAPIQLGEPTAVGFTG